MLKPQQQMTVQVASPENAIEVLKARLLADVAAPKVKYIIRSLLKRTFIMMLHLKALGCFCSTIFVVLRLAAKYNLELAA